jgi:hypothetical protein
MICSLRQAAEANMNLHQAATSQCRRPPLGARTQKSWAWKANAEQASAGRHLNQGTIVKFACMLGQSMTILVDELIRHLDVVDVAS